MAGEGTNKGWISLYRSIQDHWLWQEEKSYTKLKAWLDLLLLANHKTGKVLISNELVTVETGQHLTSQQKLMKRWGWGNTKVRNFLKLLKEDGMIDYWGENYTIIKIINYEMYQKQTEINPVISTCSQNQQTTNKLPTNRKQTDNKLQANTNNNDNNVNNDNKYINNKEKEELNPIKVYQNNIFPTPGFIEIEGIQKWSNDLGSELVIQAIEIAVKNNARNWRYIERILMDWNNNGIKTVDQAKAYSKARGGKKVGSTRQNNKKPKPKQEGEGEKLARRALEKYGDKLEDFECDF